MQRRKRGPRNAAVLTLVLAGCSAGSEWVEGAGRPPSHGGSVWIDPDLAATPRPPGAEAPLAPAAPDGAREAPGEGEPVLIREHGSPRRPAPLPAALAAPRTPAPDGAIFRNTYYDFPAEGAGAREATVFDARCAPIAKVTRDFHDRLCVQGSGRLASGATVSFAKRGCACASVCPRTGQRICFEKLDPSRFPSGRGALGRPIVPLRTVAVDSAVIPLGASVLIPEFVGIPMADGRRHDGCFVAEDRGVRVVGRHVDVFAGDPAETARLGALLPSNRGVHVLVDHPRCGRP